MAQNGLGDFYAGGGIVASGTTGTNGAVPSSGEISLSDFHGVSATAAYYSVTYTSGSGSIAIPANAGNVKVTVWGAGGSGGRSHDLNCPYGNACGCDGADGGSAQRTMSDIAGQTVTWSVGTGGAATTSWYEPGYAGGATYFGPFVGATGGEGGWNSPRHNVSCPGNQEYGGYLNYADAGNGGLYNIANDGTAGQGGTKGCACGTTSGTAGTNGKIKIEWGVGV